MTTHTLSALTERTTILQSVAALLEPIPTLIAAYLFGSVAQGKAHKQSDIDIALFFEPTLDPKTIYAHTVTIGGLLEAACAAPVDVVALNLAPLALQFKILQSGLLIVDHNPTSRCLFQMRTMSRYYDALPFLRYHQAQTVRRIQQEGLGYGYHGHRNALTEARRLRATLAPTATGEHHCSQPPLSRVPGSGTTVSQQ